MRKFRCEDCQHEFEVPHGQGGRGIEMNCPKCGGSNVFRTSSGSMQDPQGWVGRGRAAMGYAWGRWMGGTGRGRGGQGHGRRRNPMGQQANTEQKDGEQK